MLSSKFVCVYGAEGVKFSEAQNNFALLVTVQSPWQCLG